MSDDGGKKDTPKGDPPEGGQGAPAPGDADADAAAAPDLGILAVAANVLEQATPDNGVHGGRVLAADKIVLIGEGPDFSHAMALVEMGVRPANVIATYCKDISTDERDEPPDQIAAVMDDVDATRLPEGRWPNNAVLWFHMPWGGRGGTAQLIAEFLASAATMQGAGAYLVIGICTTIPERVKQWFVRKKGRFEDPGYFEEYQLPDSVSSPHYSLVEINRGVVKALLANGYKHHSDTGKKNIQWMIEDGMVLLIFKRTESAADPQPVRDDKVPTDELGGGGGGGDEPSGGGGSSIVPPV